MNIRRRAALFAAVFTMGLMGSALTASAETLAEAIASAYETNPDIRLARSALRNADESYLQARRQSLFPTLNASLTSGSGTRAVSSQTACTQYDNDNVCIRFASGTTSSQTLSGPSIGLSQQIYNGGRLGTSIKRAEINLLTQREALEDAEVRLVQSVVNAYIAVLSGQESLAITAARIQSTRQQKDDATARYEIGVQTQTDVANAESQLATAEANLANQTAQLENARATYATVVGHNPEDLKAPPPLDALLPKSAGEALEVAQKNNSTIRGVYLQERTAALALADAKSSRRPTVSTSLNLSYQPEVFQADQNTRVTGQVNLSWPLGNFNTASQVRVAEENYRNYDIRIEQAQRNLLQQVNQNWNSLQSQRGQIAAQEVAVRAAQTAFVGTREEVAVSIKTALDLLNAETSLRSTEQSLVSAKYNEYTSGISLLITMGVLEPTDLAPQIKEYDPLPHFEDLNDFKLPWENGLLAIDSIGAVRVPTRTPLPGEVIPTFDEIR